MSSNSVDGLVTLTERTVNLIKQLNMPLVEVSLVIQKHINQLMETLNQHLQATGQSVSDRVQSPWPVELPESTTQSNFALEKVMDIVDQQRMDILDTLIRVTLIEIDVTVVEALLALRQWEHLARTQLASATGPGQLFSPLDVPDDW
ncbi:MAG: hypothetical protein CMB74_04550 [Euryarchaeota archaeon]|nr:hypothetical protein [Euryarchaeota archaeon]|tara:strand:+ start:1122 stop:1562 length:441 start_codon:yes stop_codon:yes gene_type:complete